MPSLIEERKFITLRQDEAHRSFQREKNAYQLYLAEDQRFRRLYTQGLIVREKLESTWLFFTGERHKNRKLFLHMIRQAIENGIANHLESLYKELYQQILLAMSQIRAGKNIDRSTSFNSDFDERAIELIELAAPYALLVVGILLAIIIFYIEVKKFYSSPDYE